MRVNLKPRKEVSPSTTKPKVHNVLIIDASGSMVGAKYDSARSGVIMEIKELSKDENVDYTQTLIEFGSYSMTQFLMINQAAAKTKVTSNDVRWANAHLGGTALYDAVGDIITYLISVVKNDEKVLVKIFTDGEENMSRKYNASLLKALIDKAEKEHGFTVTFEGTKSDTDFVVRNLGINLSNTHVHDNTAEGITRGVQARVQSTMLYSKDVADGEDVTTGFYSKLAE